jgi:hypothetical protein
LIAVLASQNGKSEIARSCCKTSGNPCQGTTLVVPITNRSADGFSP